MSTFTKKMVEFRRTRSLRSKAWFEELEVMFQPEDHIDNALVHLHDSLRVTCSGVSVVGQSAVNIYSEKWPNACTSLRKCV